MTRGSYAEWKAGLSKCQGCRSRQDSRHATTAKVGPRRWSSIDLGSFCPCGEGRTLTGGWKATTQEVQVNVDVFWSGCPKAATPAPTASPPELRRQQREPRARRYRDDLPGVSEPVRASRAPALLLERVPADSSAIQASRPSRAGRLALRGRLRLPELRGLLPRRAKMRGLQHVVSQVRAGRGVPVLREAGLDCRPVEPRPTRPDHACHDKAEEVTSRS